MEIQERPNIEPPSAIDTRPILVSAVAYCLILLTPFILFLFLKSFTTNSASYETEGEQDPNATAATTSTLNWYENKNSTQFIMITRVSIFSAVMSFGALGAAISVITRARQGDREAISVTKREIHSVQTIGAVFALILSLIFMGGLIAGSLFPNSETFYYVIYLPAAFAKLLVWSFIAGFSERFVPNVLKNLTRRSGAEKDERSGPIT